MLKTGVLLAIFFSALLPATTPKVQMVNLQQLKSAVQKQDDTLYVVNFWATWCKPCVSEMPYFEEANSQYKSQKVKVVFVSLNSAKELPAVQKFVNDKKISSDVLLLNAGNPNNWIDSIDNRWSGSIPATIMYRNGKTVFFQESELSQTELESIIQKQKP